MSYEILGGGSGDMNNWRPVPVPQILRRDAPKSLVHPDASKLLKSYLSSYCQTLCRLTTNVRSYISVFQVTD